MTRDPAWFRTAATVVRGINIAFAAVASAITVIIVLLVLLAVGTRIGGSPALWPYDIAQFMLAYVVFLSLAPALESGHHVVVEFFDRLVPRPLRRYIGGIAMILVMIFGAIFFWQLWRTTARAFSDGRLAIAAVAIPLKWIYIVGPIGVAQLILTALVGLGRQIWPGTPSATVVTH